MTIKIRGLQAMALALVLTPAIVQAGSTDSIRACMAEVSRTTGRTLNEFDAVYQQRFLQTDLVRWSGIACEVKQGRVWSLTVDGTPTVVGGWPSPEAKAAYDQLDRDTSEAIRTLDTRRQLLAQRLKDAGAQLRAPGADIPGVSAYVHDGITQAIGK